jgi:hypothetical protein
MGWKWFLLGVLVGWLVEWLIDFYFWRRGGPSAAKPVQKDNLTRIEGIGPKLQTLLNEYGIYSYAELGRARAEKLQGLLDKAGSRYRLARPETWAEQARLAAAGEWQKLVHLQDRLSGGRRKKRGK